MNTMVPQQRTPIFDLDTLYCEEENLESDFGDFENGIENCDNSVEILKGSVFLSENELDWGDDELICLFSKEKLSLFDNNGWTSIGSSMVDRKSAVEWMLMVISHYGFTVFTAVLAVNYFDRFISSVCFNKAEKPWMTQLVAVACLSLAAKMEETQVPLLLDLQVEEMKYVFEAKTVMKMELLVLSTLEWKMSPVTPLSFIDYVIRRLGMKSHLHSRFLGSCERILISAITNPKFGTYLPSVLAAGTMLHVLKEVEPDNVSDHQTELLNVLGMDRGNVDECYEFILDLQASYDNELSHTHKRKYLSAPNSPNGVIDAYLSCDSSNDSWIATPLATSSPEPPFKRSRSQDQQMRVAPLRHHP